MIELGEVTVTDLNISEFIAATVPDADFNYSWEGNPPQKTPTQIKTACPNSLRKLFLLVVYLLYIGDLKITSTSTERQKRSQNLAPVLVIILGLLWYFLGKLLPVLVFTGAAPLACQHQ